MLLIQRVVLLLLLWYTSMGLSAQSWIPDTLFRNEKIASVYFDPLGNRYVVTREMQLYKLTGAANTWQRYNNNRMGRISYFDTSNPLLLLLFYIQNETVVFLDNNLAEITVLRLNDLGEGMIRAVAIGDDNNLWVWDESGRTMLKVNPQGEILLKGIAYFGFEIDPDKYYQLIPSGQYIYLAQPDLPIQVFDTFGKWIKSINIPHLSQILYAGKDIYCISGNQLISFNVLTPFDIRVYPEVEIDPLTTYAFNAHANRIYRVVPDKALEYFMLPGEK